MAISLVIFWMLVPVDWLPDIHGSPTPYLDLFIVAAAMWILVITLAAVLNVRILRPNSLKPPILVEFSLAFILWIGGLVIFWMVTQIEKPGYDDGSLGTLVSILLGT
jgi:hypothetical protein